MTNGEKYLKDGETGNFVQAFSCWYYGITRELENADKMLVQFLKEQAKPTLTEDERVILRNIKKFNVIGRDAAGFVYVSIEKSPTYKSERTYLPFADLFQFIKERRRILYRGTFERGIKNEYS